MNELLIKVRNEEKKDKRNGALLSVGISSSLLLLSLIWAAPPLDFPAFMKLNRDYEFTGAIVSEKAGMMDYGTSMNGNGNVNNFFDPSPTPSHSATASDAQLAEANQVKEVKNNTAVDNPTSPNPSDIKVPDKANNTTDASSNNPSNTTGGSNHGNNGITGNWGRPDVPTLSQESSFQWGTGGTGGLNGRKWLALPDPEYRVNQETKITFEFTIAPDGHVVSVKRPIGSNSSLINSGMAAIYKWTFEPVDEDKGNQNVKVTMTFKLQ